MFDQPYFVGQKGSLRHAQDSLGIPWRNTNKNKELNLASKNCMKRSVETELKKKKNIME